LIWLTESQRAKAFFSPIFCRSEPAIQSGQDGEAAAAGELMNPAVGMLIFASYPLLPLDLFASF
jgi:hypothetical protein